MKKWVYIYIAAIFVATALSGASYMAWNAADPADTCANCHEVKPEHDLWKMSAHADVKCYHCHGTALSNGIHSVKQKLGMVFSHAAGKVRNEDIRLSEDEVLEVSRRCAECHRAEGAAWISGAHSTRYKNIFEDSAHNESEKPYWDCFRCHGMFYGGDIESLMDFKGEPSEWKIKDTAQTEKFAVPCLACHKIHTPKTRPPQFMSNYERGDTVVDEPKTSFYVRAERDSFRTDNLTPVPVKVGGKIVETSKDPNNTLCLQCHSPDWTRTAHTSDDRTPVGAHKGFSCVVCHDPHSNSAENSCAKCHDSSIDKYKFKKGARCNF